MAETAFGIGSFLLGGIIGAITEHELSSGISAAYFAVLVLAVALFAIIVMVLSFAKEQDVRDRDVLSALVSIEKRLGLKVSYQQLKDIADGTRDDILPPLVREANFEILEVNRSDVHEPEVNPDLAVPDLRQKYFDSILKRVETQWAKTGAFTYKRIIQFPQTTGRIRSLGDRIYVDHCKRMVILQQSKGIHCYVKRTLMAFPTSFLIVDRQYLVLALDSICHREGTSQEHQKSEIIISDPQQELVRVFLQEWDKIENSQHTQTVAMDEF
jgi:hypothetical protein